MTVYDILMTFFFEYFQAFKFNVVFFVLEFPSPTKNLFPIILLQSGFWIYGQKLHPEITKMSFKAYALNLATEDMLIRC